MKGKFSPQKTDISPKIYAYEDAYPQYKGLLILPSINCRLKIFQTYLNK